eukprot:6185480-Pleurochrysis_carterae.AAC.3
MAFACTVLCRNYYAVPRSLLMIPATCHKRATSCLAARFAEAQHRPYKQAASRQTGLRSASPILSEPPPWRYHAPIRHAAAVVMKDWTWRRPMG